MIQANSINLSFGTQAVFDDLSFTVNGDERIGLVGRNGSGKSTLLKAIQDPSVLDDGSVSIQKNKIVAYMPQDVVLLSDKTIVQEAFSAFEKIHALMEEAKALEVKLETESTLALVERYAAVQEALSDHNPDMAMAKAKRLLMGLGFCEAQFSQPVSTLSVGWKMRIVLAKLLLMDADFYLFDEPTNHLDIVAKEWFLNFLKTSTFGFMIVCHEKYFLDELCTEILELERGTGTFYNGNYSRYLIQKEQALERLMSSYEQQQKEIQHKKMIIEKFRAKASKAKMAQSMIKALDRVERIVIPPGLKDVRFTFPPLQQAGRVVLTVENLAYSFGEKQIFRNVSFEVEREQKVAIIAPNGVGKSTLFNIIAGILPIQTGKITYGYNVKHAIFAQDQNKILDLDANVLSNIQRLCGTKTEQVVRTFLGSFLFSGDDVQKKTRVLSGGEKNRVGMVATLLQDANLLLLDEPTNHLDIPSKEILLKALQEFKGTILFVSHDRDFVNDLATHVIDLNHDSGHLYHGNFDAYQQQKNDLARESGGISPFAKLSTERPGPKSNQPEPIDKKRAHELHKKNKQLENTIEKLEKQITRTELSFADLTYGPEFNAAQEKLIKLKQELKTAEAEWEEVQKERNPTA